MNNAKPKVNGSLVKVNEFTIKQLKVPLAAALLLTLIAVGIASAQFTVYYPTITTNNKAGTGPGGLSSDVQYNCNGVFCGDGGLTWVPGAPPLPPSVIDSSANHNNGFPENGTMPTPNAFLGSHAGYFDGINQFIDIPYSPTIHPEGSSFSISMWINGTDLHPSADQILIDDYGNNNYYGYSLSIDRSACGGYALDFAKSYVTDQCSNSSTFNNDQWYFITVVQNYLGGTPTNVTFYVNGTLLSIYSDTNQFHQPTSAQHGDIANGGNSGGLNYYQGTIDEVAVWNIGLNQTQITNIYGQEVNGIELDGANSSINQLYHMNESSWPPGGGGGMGLLNLTGEINGGHANLTYINLTGSLNFSKGQIIIGSGSNAINHASVIGLDSFGNYYGFVFGSYSSANNSAYTLGNYNHVNNTAVCAGFDVNCNNEGSGVGLYGGANNYSIFEGPGSSADWYSGAAGFVANAYHHSFSFGNYTYAFNNSYSLGNHAYASFNSTALGNNAWAENNMTTLRGENLNLTTGNLTINQLRGKTELITVQQTLTTTCDMNFSNGILVVSGTTC